MVRPKSDRLNLNLRLPPRTHGPIKAAAEANGRSLNAEVVARLEASLSEPGQVDVVAIERRILATVEANIPRLLAAGLTRGR